MSRKTSTYARKLRAGHGQPVRADNFAIAAHNALAFNAQEIEGINGHMKRHYDALRQGRAARTSFAGICTYCELGLAIERMGVVRGLGEQLKKAEDTLRTIKARCDLPSGWRPPVLNWQEMAILDELRTMHLFQLRQLSYAEYKRAWEMMVCQVEKEGDTFLVEPEETTA